MMFLAKSTEKGAARWWTKSSNALMFALSKVNFLFYRVLCKQSVCSGVL